MPSRATDESPVPNPPDPSTPPPFARLLVAIFLLTLATTALLLAQQFYGLGPTTTHLIPPNRIQKTDDYFRWKLPEHERTNLVENRAVLLENGHPWPNQSLSNRDLRQFGAGWFCLNDGGVNFIPLDGVDPRQIPPTFSLTVPLQFKPKTWKILTALLAIQLLLLLRTDALQTVPLPSPSRLTFPLLFALAAITVILSLQTRQNFTDHAFTIKGLQESDASGWFTMADRLAQGHGLTGGFENQRPFYTFFLGSLFALFGTSLAALKALNAFGLILAIGGVFSLGALLHSRSLGLSLALALLLSDTHLNTLHIALTENGGLALSIFALLTVWLATWHLSRPWALASGLLSGLAVLTSGITIFTLPTYALILTLTPILRRSPWQRALTLGITYTCAATLVIGSWLVRQKIVHDRITLSFNTADVLSGGSDPIEKRFTGKILEKASTAGFDLSDAEARYDSLMAVFRQNVANDPGGYIKQVAHALWTSPRYLPFNDRGVQFAALLALLTFGTLTTLRSRQPLPLVITASLMLLWIHQDFIVTPILLFAAAFLTLRRATSPAERLTTVLLLFTLLATMFLAGLSGNVATRRFWLVTDWSAIALLFAGARHFILATSNLGHHLLTRLRLPHWLTGTALPSPASAALDAPPFIRIGSATLLTFAALATLIIVTQTLRGPHSTLGPLDVKQLAVPLPTPPLTTRIVMLTDAQATFQANEGTQHWLSLYRSRPYPRWIAHFTLLDSFGEHIGILPALGQGSLHDLPRNTPLLLAGLFSPGKNHINSEPSPIFEALSLTPLTRSGPDSPWQLDYTSQTTFPLTSPAPTASSHPPDPAPTRPAPAAPPPPPAPPAPPASSPTPPPPPHSPTP